MPVIADPDYVKEKYGSGEAGRRAQIEFINQTRAMVI